MQTRRTLSSRFVPRSPSKWKTNLCRTGLIMVTTGYSPFSISGSKDKTPLMFGGVESSSLIPLRMDRPDHQPRLLFLDRNRHVYPCSTYSWCNINNSLKLLSNALLSATPTSPYLIPLPGHPIPSSAPSNAFSPHDFISIQTWRYTRCEMMSKLKVGGSELVSETRRLWSSLKGRMLASGVR